VADQERQVAEAERQRAVKAEMAVSRRARYLAAALVFAVVAAIVAILFGNAAQKNERTALDALATVQASGSNNLALGALATEEAMTNPDVGAPATPPGGNPSLAGGRIVVRPSTKPIRLVIGNFVNIQPLGEAAERVRQGLLLSLEANQSQLGRKVELADWNQLQVGPIRGASVEEIDRSAASAALHSSTDILIYAIALGDGPNIRILPRYVMRLDCSNFSQDILGPAFFSTPGLSNSDNALGNYLRLDTVEGEPGARTLQIVTDVLFERVVEQALTAASKCP